MSTINIETTREELSKEYQRVNTALANVIQPYLTMKGVVIANVRTAWNSEDGLEMTGRAGFVDEKDERIFGADFSVDFEKGELKINCGTMGTYSKANVAQVQLYTTIANIWQYVNVIEAAIKDVLSTSTFAALQRQVWDWENEQERIKREAITAKKAEINNSLIVGMRVIDKRNVIFEVANLGPKRITLKSGKWDDISYIDREKFVNSLFHEGFKVTEA